HQFFERVRGLDGVGSWELVGGDDGAWFAIEAADGAVVLCAEFYAGNIFDADDAADGRFANHDLAELFGRTEAALGADGIRKFLAFGDGFTANLAGRIYGVLGQDRVDDFWNGDRKFGELIRLDPEA